MQEVITYRTIDGEVFEFRHQAEAYEEKIRVFTIQYFKDINERRKGFLFVVSSKPNHHFHAEEWCYKKWGSRVRRLPDDEFIELWRITDSTNIVLSSKSTIAESSILVKIIA